jgi:hypothetical protein
MPIYDDGLDDLVFGNTSPTNSNYGNEEDDGLNDLVFGGVQEELPEGSYFDEVTQPIRALGSGMAHSALGGLAGAATLLGTGDVDKSVDMLDAFNRRAYVPTTSRGRDKLAGFGEDIQSLTDSINVPLSYAGGVTELALNPNTQGFEQASETVDNIQQDGLGVTLGDRVMEETGNPEWATMARIAPEAAVEVLGLKGAGTAIRRVPDVMDSIPAGTPQNLLTGVKTVAEGADQLVTAVKEVQLPKGREAAAALARGKTDAVTANYDLKREGIEGSRAGEVDNLLPTSVNKTLNVGGPRAIKNPLMVETTKQGWKEKDIAKLRNTADEDKLRIKEMLDVKAKALKNADFDANNRPSDIAGRTLMTRYNIIEKANAKAAKAFDSGVAESLKGKSIDVSKPMDNFIKELESQGIRFDAPDGAKSKGVSDPDFSSSNIEGAEDLQKIVTSISKRLRDTDVPDAHDVHRLKRMIDQQVKYGQSKSGLGGEVEATIKKLRHDMNEALTGKSKAYDQVNSTYSETIKSMSDFQEIMGRKVKLNDAYTDSVVGTKLRQLDGNRMSRGQLEEIVVRMEEVAKRHGKVKGDVVQQYRWANSIEEKFGGADADTSLKGDLTKSGEAALFAKENMGGKSVSVASQQRAFALAVNTAGRGVDWVRGINTNAAFDSLYELLEKGPRRQ